MKVTQPTPGVQTIRRTEEESNYSTDEEPKVNPGSEIGHKQKPMMTL